MSPTATSPPIAAATPSPISPICACADPHDWPLPRIWELRDNLTAHAAAYLALAEALDAPLLTRDRRLAAAAGPRARIELI